MKTPEYYLDEVAKERNQPDFIQVTRIGSPQFIKAVAEEAMLRHSKEACEEQRKIIANSAKIFFNGDTAEVDKQSIINAKSPIE